MQTWTTRAKNYPIKMFVAALLMLGIGIALLVAVNCVIKDIIENNMRLLLIKSETEEFIKTESLYLQGHINTQDQVDLQLLQLHANNLSPLIHAALFGGETPLGSLQAVTDPHMHSDLQLLDGLLAGVGQPAHFPGATALDQFKSYLAQVGQLSEDVAGDVGRLINASRYRLIFLQASLFLIMLTLFFGLVQAYRRHGLALKEQDRQIREEMARSAELETLLERNQNQLQGLEKANARLVLINASVSQLRDAGELSALAKRNEDLLRKLVKDTMALTKASSGALAILDNTGRIQSFIAEGREPELEALIGSWGQDGVAALFKDKTVLRMKPTAKDFQGHPGICNLLGVPLIVSGTCRGALYLADKLEGDEFSDDDETLLRLYAFDLVSAIERADFIRELQDRNNQLQRKQDEQEKLIHQLKTAQMQLLQSEKMASIGQLAAGVAHEINNPIGYVGSNLVSLQRYIDDICGLLREYEKVEQCLPIDSRAFGDLQKYKKSVDLEFIRQDLRDILMECSEGVHRVRKIVNDLKDFSHIPETDWQWVDVHKGLDSTLNIAHNEIKYKARVVKEYGDLPAIECMPQQLNQVFMNLLVNAAQAVEQQGIITVRSGVEGEGIWIEIADNGRGIVPEHMPHLFEPFFTTKPAGKGTGLGLAISYRIIKEHGGHITANSEPGKGAAFRIWLPAKQMYSGAKKRSHAADTPLSIAKEG